MKHIKIAVIITPISNAIQIIEQTHIGYRFGEDGESFLATNGLRLSSVDCPQYSSAHSILYVRGADNDSDTVIIPIESMVDIKKIIEAVNEYNKYFFNEENKEDKPYSIEIIG